jgi:protein-tyrosine phosphatase
MIRVLFVCTGNICRSPTAEAVLRAHLDKEGLGERVEVDSAGTGGWHVGDAPTAIARQVALDKGYDMSGLRARKIDHDDFERFDLILALDRGHLAILERLGRGKIRAKLALLRSYAEDHPIEVPDPYYGGRRDYEYALGLIEGAMPGLLAALTDWPPRQHQGQQA